MSRSRLSWSYDYAALASLCDCSEDTVRQHVHRGNVAPDDLLSVVKFALRYSSGPRKSELILHACNAEE